MSEKTQNSASGNTTAFFVMAGVSFAIALLAITIGIWNLDIGAWERAFLALGSLFLTTSTFTLAKCVRDAQESAAVVARLDAARVERILADHDPFKAVG
jgi:hypothetical protein